MDQNWTNQNGILQLTVGYMGPLATLIYHLEWLTPPDTRSHPQGGVIIYPKGKFTIQNHEKKITYITKKII